MVFGPRRHASLMSLAAGLAVLPLAALAEIEEEAAAFTAERPVKVQLFEDLDLDGDREALLQFDADCDARGCPWALLASGEDGTASEVGGGRAQDISLVPTAPEGAVIDADSVLWAYTNGEFYPYFSALERPDANPVPPSNADYDRLAALTEYDDPSHFDLKVWSQDITGDGQRERIMVIGGIYWAMNGGSISPYVVFSATGDLLAQGYSMEIPRIYPRPEGGARIIGVGARAFVEKDISG